MRRRAVVDWSKSQEKKKKIIPLALPRRCQFRNKSREGAAGAEGTVISAGANAVRAWKLARGRAGHRRAASVARGGPRSRR